jgi:uncharacterized protein YprB with RNaseH-like and TPR domain
LTEAARLLAGTLVERVEGVAIVVDREYRPGMLHGGQKIGDIVSTIRESGTSPLGVPESEDGPLLFLDLETTGLAGGAGTQAFLIGCAVLDDDGIRTRQFLLPGFEHERAVLHEFAAFARAHGALVTFNGRSFDAPLIETRFLFNRLPYPLEALSHLDMLHASRRLWRTRPMSAGQNPDGVTCSLSTLEKDVVGLHRIGDVPGYEIPSRFFRFVRDGDARPLEAVLEHNRLDLLSTSAVMARVLTLLDRGPSATSSAPECLGLARLYERVGAATNAEGALLHAIHLARLVGSEPAAHGEALRRLAWLRRRTRRPYEAADAWSELATLPGCPDSWRREAREALAIFHEHRSRDLGTARELVLDLLGHTESDRRRESAEHRLRRIDRKLAARPWFQLPLT